ncbi:hypothetical protein V2J09_023211 [Rumex salicifolius]
MTTMEYGQSDRSEPDPGTEGSGQGDDSGLQESMWNLGLSGGGAAGGSIGGGESTYPERPGEPNCIYYMRTGFCGYGERCRFNHPRDRSEAYRGGRTSGEDYPERDGQPLCQYNHPRQEAASATAVTLSVYGFPLRPGDKECSYYMKTGQCKFGVTCKFNHPLPTNVQVPTSIPAATGQSSATPPQYGVPAGSWQVARPPMMPASYIQGAYGPMLLPSGVVPYAGWTPYQVPVSAVPAPSMSSLSAKAPSYTGPTGAISSFGGPSIIMQNEPSYPERPGQAECQHYLRTGECKYGPSCRYHHPADRTAYRESFTLTPMGLPFRPGSAPCSYFMQHGVCKFGPTCKYNHPMGSLSYSPSASSLSDIPVAPYPVGSSAATLAPSSSSSDLRAKVITGSNYNSTTTSASPSDTVLTKNGSDPSSTSEQGGNTHDSSVDFIFPVVPLAEKTGLPIPSLHWKLLKHCLVNE